MAQDGVQAVKSEIRNPQSAIQIPPVTYDSALIESVVRQRVDAAADTDTVWIAPYRDELNEIYESPEQDRSTAFAALDRRYFNRIGVPAVVDECLAAQAPKLSRASSVTLISAHARAEEGVDVTRDGRLVLRYRPEALLSIDQFRANLRRELIQAADCYNPSFGHAPDLLDNMLPSEKERIRAALSTLWAISAACRLENTKWQMANDKAARDVRDAFLNTPDAPVNELLAGLPNRPPTFPEMFHFCKTHLGSQAVATGICDLCRFPSEDAVFLRALRADACSALKAEFPHLTDAAQVCARCVERAIENV